MSSSGSHATGRRRRRLGALVLLAAGALLVPALGAPESGRADVVAGTLSVVLAGGGGGSVTSDPAGVDCGSSCSAPFAPGTSVTLSAAASAGSAFVGWTACPAPAGAACAVTMPEDGSGLEVTATFAATATLTVTKSGAGAGTVTSDPAGIACGATCSASFVSGTQVTLTATAAPGSAFVGWSGPCAGTGTCTLAAGDAAEVGAEFEPAYALAVIASGDGAGTVASDPAGIDCGSTCTASFLSGTSVTLAATPAAGSTFGGWSGPCSGTGSCTVVLDAAKTVVASFVRASFALGVVPAGTGTGTVTSEPAGINCGTSCSYPYPSGTVVTLTAAPAAGSTFDGWSGACSGTAATCKVAIEGMELVGATFTKAVATLAVSRGGSGSGRVTSSPAGIDCGSSCSSSFEPGASVALTAVAATGSLFGGWSGDCSGTSPSCTVSVSGAKTVTATFVPAAVLTVTKAGTGTGTVTSTPVGIACGTACSAPFSSQPAASVTLRAVPASGSVFTGWTGACAGVATSCVVSTASSLTVGATFASGRVSVSVAKTGSGTVKSSPAGIDCGSTCSATFAASATGDVVLIATPAAGSTFSGWSGACSGSDAACTLPLTASAEVGAAFVADATAQGRAAVATLRKITFATPLAGRRSVLVRMTAPAAASVVTTAVQGKRTLATARVSFPRAGTWQYRVLLPAGTKGSVRLTMVATDAASHSVTIARTISIGALATVKGVARAPAAGGRQTVLVRLRLGAAATVKGTATLAGKRLAGASAKLKKGARVLRLVLPASAHGRVTLTLSVVDAKGNSQSLARTVSVP